MNSILKNIFWVLISISFMNSLLAQQTPLIIEGSYQGKSIYVKNPYRNEKVGFCVSKVTVNGEVTTDEVNSASFEIDLNQFQFLIGDKVDIKIYHAEGCKPKVINPEVLEPKSTYIIEDINVGDDLILNWKTTGETGKLTYNIEQFKWNEWVKVGEVEGTGTPNIQQYKFKVNPHSGENKFRVYQKDNRNKKRVSKATVFNSESPKITFYPKKVRKDIVFSNKTSYEVYDTFGNVVKKGSGETLNCTSFKKGFYYLKFDNEVGTFNKK